MTVPSPLNRLPPHALRHGVLPADEHAALLEWTLANEAALAPSVTTGAGADPQLRRARSLYGDAPWKAPMGERILALVPGLVAELGMVPFEIERLEIEMVAYPDGGFIDRHFDTATRGTRHPHDRVVSVVYYFHREPKPYRGGELRLLPRVPLPGGPSHVDIVPEQNSLVAFPSWAIHEVLPVSSPSGRFEDSRFAINFWVLRARRGGQQ